jgi:hypothetical protein
MTHHTRSVAAIRADMSQDQPPRLIPVNADTCFQYDADRRVLLGELDAARTALASVTAERDALRERLEKSEYSNGLLREKVKAVRVSWVDAQREAEAEGCDMPRFATALLQRNRMQSADLSAAHKMRNEQKEALRNAGIDMDGKAVAVGIKELAARLTATAAPPSTTPEPPYHD